MLQDSGYISETIMCFKSLLFHERVDIAVISNNSASFSVDMFNAWIVLSSLLLGKLMFHSYIFRTD